MTVCRDAWSFRPIFYWAETDEMVILGKKTKSGTVITSMNKCSNLSTLGNK